MDPGLIAVIVVFGGAALFAYKIYRDDEKQRSIKEELDSKYIEDIKKMPIDEAGLDRLMSHAKFDCIAPLPSYDKEAITFMIDGKYIHLVRIMAMDNKVYYNYPKYLNYYKDYDGIFNEAEATYMANWIKNKEREDKKQRLLKREEELRLLMK